MSKYLDLEKTTTGNLKMTLTDEGKEFLENCGDEELNVDIFDVLEHQLCNGWDRIRPEEIRALTSCDLIITDDITRDDDDKILELGTIYWHPNYMVEDPIEVLQKVGYLVLTGVPK